MTDRQFSVEWSPGLPRGSCFESATEPDVALQPTGFLTGEAAAAALASGLARPVAGGPVAFSACVVMLADRSRLVRAVASLARIEEWCAGEAAWLRGPIAARMDRITRPRPAFAGLDLDRARLIGVVNVTPDSFSDGGDRFTADAAIAAGLEMAEAGADLIDVGGESTRPGAADVSPQAEADRVLPVIAALAERGIGVSVDTRRASVMGAAIEAGARVVNDVSALAAEPDAVDTVAAAGADVILMHMQGEPRTMQRAPRYADAPFEVFAFLDARLRAVRARGIPIDRIAVDPGIGFGKNDSHNAAILSAIGLLHGTGCAVVLGASRKSFIGRMSRREPPKDRVAGSIGAVVAAALQGVQLFRVHDVAQTRQALAILARLGGLGVT